MSNRKVVQDTLVISYELAQLQFVISPTNPSRKMSDIQDMNDILVNLVLTKSIGLETLLLINHTGNMCDTYRY